MVLRTENIPKVVQYVFWICALSSIVFATSGSFADPQIVPKWVAFVSLSLLLLVYLALRLLFGLKDTPGIFPDMKVMVNSISFVLLFLSVYGILQYFEILQSDVVFKVVGKYENPAGFAITLCAGLPFVMLGMISQSRYIRFLNIMVFALVSVAVILSQSRAGIISMLTVWIIGGYSFLTKRTFLRWAFVAVLCVVLLALMCQKSDSASGRMLIWNCTWDMIAARPLFGYGLGGFEANYMDWQAAYFQQNPDSTYAMLADDIQYPFNEYLHVMSVFGVLGLLCVMFWIGFMIWRYWRNRTPERLTAVLVIVSVSVFAMFSYPSMYPFMWLMVIYSSAVLLSDADSFKKMPSLFRRTFAVILIGLAGFIGAKLICDVESEKKWYALATSSDKREDTLEKYARLYERMSGDRYFMYNYAYVLYDMDRLDDSRRVAAECRELWADYDLEILRGMIEMRAGNHSAADSHFEYAGFMCPNRFRPLYLRMKIAEAKEDVASAIAYAQQIMDKQIKVLSNEVVSIRQYAKGYLNKYN